MYVLYSLTRSYGGFLIQPHLPGTFLRGASFSIPAVAGSLYGFVLVDDFVAVRFYDWADIAHKVVADFHCVFV